MKLTLAKIICSVMALSLLSCEKQDIKQPELIKQKFARELHYVYKGEEIKLTYIAQGDSFAVVKDDNAKRLDHIFSLPTQTTFVNCKDLKTLYLYDTYKDFEKDKGATVTQSTISSNTNQGPASRTTLCGTTPPSGYLYNRVSLFADDNLSGDEYLLNYTTTDPNNRCYNRAFFTTMGVWNDRVSSLITNADFPPGQEQELAMRMTMWTSEYYDGSTIIFQANPGTVGQVNRLGDYTYGGFFSRRSWNDEPSSFQLNIFSFVN